MALQPGMAEAVGSRESPGTLSLLLLCTLPVLISTVGLGADSGPKQDYHRHVTKA